MMPELRNKCEATKEQYYQVMLGTFEKPGIQDYEILLFEDIYEGELKILKLKEELKKNCKMFINVNYIF